MSSNELRTPSRPLLLESTKLLTWKTLLHSERNTGRKENAQIFAALAHSLGRAWGRGLASFGMSFGMGEQWKWKWRDKRTETRTVARSRHHPITSHGSATFLSFFLKLPTPYHSFPAFLTGWGTFQSGTKHILRFR